MKSLLVTIFIVFGFSSYGQFFINSLGGIQPLGYYAATSGQWQQGGTKIYADTTAMYNDSVNSYLRDTVTFVALTIADSSFWVLRGGIANSNFVKIASGNGSGGGGYDTFTSNVTMYGTSIGKYAAGTTAPWKGLTAVKALVDAATNCIHPTYNAPQIGIGASPSFGSYEYGTNIGTVTLSPSYYNQNNGGSTTSTNYYANGTIIGGGGNTFTISSLTTQQYASVTRGYGQGACIADNCGNIDCYGRINAGSVSSSNGYFTPFNYRYWGWVNTNTPTDATIQGLNKDGTGALTLTVNNTTGSAQYFVYYHPSNTGVINYITVNGVPSTAAFTITTITFVNAQGASYSYERIISNNALTGTLSFVFSHQ